MAASKSDPPVSNVNETDPATEAESAADDMDETFIPSDSDGDESVAAAVTKGDSSKSAPPKASGKKTASRTKAAKKPDKQLAKTAAQPKKATQLGDFKLIKKLGQGGMGEVYLATQVSLDRKVAVKVLAKDLAKKKGFVERFTREARSMAKIDHPNAVKVFAADSDKGLHYAAIEFIDGQSMQDWIDKLGTISVGDALHVTILCAEALNHAHELTLIHRDIKPDNILLTNKGVVKVADFGLAKATDEDVSMTQSGTGLGTPLYMPPEQARNAKNVDHRTDIYALGCTLYYFVTGDLPYTGDSMLELIVAKEKGKFDSARKRNSQVPQKLDLMIDKMIAKEPNHRYESCAALLNDLQSLRLANDALSFIEGAVSVPSLRAASAQQDTATTAPDTKTRKSKSASKPLPAGVARTSAEDAAATELKKSAVLGDDMWFVKHKNAKGKVTITKMTTTQIEQGIKAAVLNVSAKAKRSMTEDFLPLSQFPQFTSLMKTRVVKAKADSRSGRMQEMYATFSKQEKRRNRRRWLRGKTEGFFGFISLTLLIGGISGIIYYLFRYGGRMIEWVANFFKNM